NLSVVASLGVNFSNGKQRRNAPRETPGCLVEGIVSLVVALLVTERQAETIKRLAIVGIWISCRQRRDRLAKISFRLDKLATLQMPNAKGVIATRVTPVTAQSFAPVILRLPRSITILLKAEANQV